MTAFDCAYLRGKVPACTCPSRPCLFKQTRWTHGERFADGPYLALVDELAPEGSELRTIVKGNLFATALHVVVLLATVRSKHRGRPDTLVYQDFEIVGWNKTPPDNLKEHCARRLQVFRDSAIASIDKHRRQTIVLDRAPARRRRKKAAA